MALLRRLSVVCPYPRQLTAGLLAGLQPLLQWSWLTTLPLGIAETSRRPSPPPATANYPGRLLFIGAPVATQRCGPMVEDVALVRAIKVVGGRGGVADGTTIAECRDVRQRCRTGCGLYEELVVGVRTPTGAGFAMAALMLAYVVPPAAALASRRPKLRALGLLGYGAAVAGRCWSPAALGPGVPDPLSHPVSILALVASPRIRCVGTGQNRGGGAGRQLRGDISRCSGGLLPDIGGLPRHRGPEPVPYSEMPPLAGEHHEPGGGHQMEQVAA